MNICMCYSILRGGLNTWKNMVGDEGETQKQKWGTSMSLGSGTLAKPTPRFKAEVEMGVFTGQENA